MSIRRIFGSLMIVLGLTGTASASIIVTEGNVGSIPDANVLANSCDVPVNSGEAPNLPTTSVQGCLAQPGVSNDLIVNFTADQFITYTGGQATVASLDGNGFNTLLIALASGTFTSLILDIDAITDGFVTFDGIPGGTSASFALKGSGSNFFTITGENFNSVSFAATVGVALGVADVKQVRIGNGGDDDDVTVVPEPASLLLLGTGLLGVAARARRRLGMQ